MHLYLDTILEALGAALSLHGIWALTNGKSIGWLTGLIGIVIMAVLCYLKALYGQVVLQFYFAATSVYGWWAWQADTAIKDFMPEVMPTKFLIWSSIIGVLAWPACWYLLLKLNGTEPGIDAFVVAASMLAQWWQTRKYTEAWWLWVVVNVVSMVLFGLTGSYTYLMLYFALLLLAIRGGLNWTALAKQKANNDLPPIHPN